MRSMPLCPVTVTKLSSTRRQLARWRKYSGGGAEPQRAIARRSQPLVCSPCLTAAPSRRWVEGMGVRLRVGWPSTPGGGEKFPNTGIVSTARKMSPLASQHRRRRTHGARGAAQLCRHGIQHCLWGACGSGSITARHSDFRPGHGPGLPHCIGDAWCWRCSKGTHTRRGHRTGRCGVGEFGGGRRR